TGYFLRGSNCRGQTTAAYNVLSLPTSTSSNLGSNGSLAATEASSATGAPSACRTVVTGMERKVRAVCTHTVRFLGKTPACKPISLVSGSGSDQGSSEARKSCACLGSGLAL